MKEVTEWNGKPRFMWCWDEDVEHKRKDFVLCILNKEQRKELGCVGAPYVVRTYANSWVHCAEIEEEKRPCSGGELLEMLKAQATPFLRRRKSVFNDVAVARVSDSSVEMCNGEYCTYEQLCEHYTLLDGTELWKEN